jgi:hypothetical protein
VCFARQISRFSRASRRSRPARMVLANRLECILDGSFLSIVLENIPKLRPVVVFWKQARTLIGWSEPRRRGSPDPFFPPSWGPVRHNLERCSGEKQDRKSHRDGGSE